MRLSRVWLDSQSFRAIAGVLIGAVCSVWSAAVLSAASPAWVQQVESVIGTKGKVNPDGVVTWNIIRPGLSFSIRLANGGYHVSLKPAMASGNVAFKSTSGGQALMTLEFPLLEDEVDSFASALQAGGVRVTAIHNHYLLEKPKIIYVHGDALGAPGRLAQALKGAWSTIRARVDADGEPDGDDRSRLDPNEIASILGGEGEALDHIVDVTVGRNERVVDVFGRQAIDLPSEMGPQSDFEFQPIGRGMAFVIGEVCVTADESQRVLHTLRSAGFDVTALHNHFLTEEPRLFFMHLQGMGKATDLARAIRAALDQTNSQH
jgi:hypothetical protein